MRRINEAGPRAAHTVAAEIQRTTEPFVPASGAPSGMANRTQVNGDTIIYPGPYARYLYYGKVMVFTDPPYLRTVNGKAVLTHYGQRKSPIDKPLKIKQSVNPKAQSHWFDGSKARNKQQWIRTAEEAIERELR